MESSLPLIPTKRYFTIGEVANLCGVKPHVLRYWEQEFSQLKPMKRRGNRRYYQHHEVMMIRRIRDLLYEQGFTIVGARNKMQELMQAERRSTPDLPNVVEGIEVIELTEAMLEESSYRIPKAALSPLQRNTMRQLRQELLAIQDLLSQDL